jgi:hypothetical protein
MPRVAWFTLVLMVLVVGAGVLFLTGQSPASATHTSPVNSPDTAQETWSAPVSPADTLVSTTYESELEGTFASSTFKSERHFCDDETQASMSGY